MNNQPSPWSKMLCSCKAQMADRRLATPVTRIKWCSQKVLQTAAVSVVVTYKHVRNVSTTPVICGGGWCWGWTRGLTNWWLLIESAWNVKPLDIFLRELQTVSSRDCGDRNQILLMDVGEKSPAVFFATVTWVFSRTSCDISSFVRVNENRFKAKKTTFPEP